MPDEVTQEEGVEAIESMEPSTFEELASQLMNGDGQEEEADQDDGEDDGLTEPSPEEGEGDLEEKRASPESKTTYTTDQLETAVEGLEDQLDVARAEGDVERVKELRGHLRTVNRALKDQLAREAEQSKTAEREQAEINEHLKSVFDETKTLVPELLEEGSAIREAAIAEYKARPGFYDQMGALGDIVAAALVVLRTQKGQAPAKGKKTADIIDGLDKAAKSAMRKPSSSSPKSGRPVNVEELSSEEFNRLAQELERGAAVG